MLLTNEELDAKLEAGGNRLALLLAQKVQEQAPLNERNRQLVWRWASMNVFVKCIKHYRWTYRDQSKLFKYAQWWKVNANNPEAYDHHTERILQFLEFIRDYRNRDGEIPPPAVVLKAWHFRFNELEMVRRGREFGIAITDEQARQAANVERYFRASNNSVEGAVEAFRQEMLDKYNDWLHNPRNKKKTAPQYPTDLIIKNFRKKVQSWAITRDIIMARTDLDDLVEEGIV